MKLVVFTAVVGTETDPLRPVQAAYGIRYLCFTDQPIDPAGWEIRPLTGPSILDAVHRARELKILAHRTLEEESPDVSLWVDAAYELRVDPRGVADQYLWRADVAAFPHPDRRTIEEEGTALIRLGKVRRPVIEAQLERYHAMDAHRPYKLTSTGYLLRRHSPRVTFFNTTWWALLQHGGHPRDQMTVDWAAAVCHIDVGHLPGHYRDNPYAKWHRMPTPRRR